MKRFTPARKIIPGIILLLCCVVLSCEEPDMNDQEQVQEDLSMKVEKAGPNPFTAENMKQAISNVLARQQSKSGRTTIIIPSTTHNYVKFAPQNVDQLLTLHNWGYDLYDVPLDQEIITSGEYYHDPSLPADAITFQYTLVPDNYSLPASVPYTVLYQVFLFDENAGDELDLEPDPWTPTPGDGYCYDEYGSPYLCGTNPRVYLRKGEQKLPEDLYRKATVELLKAGINLKELHNEAMRLVGLKDEMIPIGLTNGKTQAFSPYGYIRVADDLTGLMVPVKNVTVKSRRFFKIDEAMTDANGYYAIRKNYRQKAHVVLKFRNNDITIRGISGAFKVWEYAQALEKEVGLFTSGPINVNLAYVADADTYGALQWAAAHAMNTHYEMKQYSATNALPGPHPFLNVWISSAWTRAASAPMLSALGPFSVELNDALNFILAASPEIVKPIIRAMFINWRPDVTLRLQQTDANGNLTTITQRASQLSNTFFHEFAHSQHYAQVGKVYWAIVIANTIAKLGYGTKTSLGAGRTAVVESWGFFIGNTFNEIKYRAILNNPDATAFANQERFELESQIPFDTHWRGWIPFGALHDMRDVGEPAITTVIDNVSGYSISGLFGGYQPGVTTVQELRQEILNRNGSSQAPQVNELITSYRW